jgi:predicted DsbA family dithiol-disulfide isomerase
MGAGESIRFDIFFDYTCPFVFRASRLLQAVRRSGERNVESRWRYFSLTQVNSKDEGWTVWDAPASEHVRGRLAFAAAEAARRQYHFEQLHERLLLARHRDQADIEDRAVVERLAIGAGLDVGRFRRDLADPSILETLARDHTEAVSVHGVFGTPTFVFAGGPAAYVRLAESATGNGVVEVFDNLVTVAAREPGILEIKRPYKR